ncbi:MAG TPA: putative metal-binding motif-containing protein [Solirubrobacteraceae bacterium]|nr:putative metal-binding motif-containing protein [Solirubrobacteraceae bacterium]
MLKRALVVALGALVLVPAAASAQGTFSGQAGILTYQGDAGVDQISGVDMGATIRFTRFGGVTVGGGLPCVITADGQSADCDKAEFDIVLLQLGDGDDVASIASNVTVPVIFQGGAGNDGLFGGGGQDQFFGGPGNDNIIARDGRGEQVDCGDGFDTAISDDADGRVSCEEIEGDADGDGVRRPRDCDDTNPAIHPGAREIPDDRIDQDCSGADATDLDRDNDGSPRPQDCNDANPRVRPGKREIPGNKVDENCDTEVVPFPPIPGIVLNAWVPAGSGTRNVTLSVKGLPRRTRLTLRCSGGGCPGSAMKRQVRRRGKLNLHGFLGDRALHAGARLDMQFALRRHMGRVLRFRMGAAGQPTVGFFCRAPGERTRPC